MTKNQLEMRVCDLESARDYWKKLYEQVKEEMEYQKDMKEEMQRLLIAERKESGKPVFTELSQKSLDELVNRIKSTSFDKLIAG